MKKILSWVEKNEFIVVLLLVVAILRIPSLYEPYWYGDEGIYLVLGQALRAGEVWYRDIHDNKPPLLYLLAAIASNVMFFRLILLVWSLVNIWLIYVLIKRFVKNNWGVMAGTVLFALLSTLPIIEGHIANAEIFMILPVTLSVLFLTKQNPIRRDFFIAGALMAGAFLFKVPAIFDFVALGFWLLILGGVRRAKNKDWFVDLVFYTSGFLALVGVTFVYYIAVGAGFQYLTAAFAQNIGYLSSWRTGSVTKSGISTQSGLLYRGIVLLLVLIALMVVNFREKSKMKLTLSWFMFALFGALLSERPYPHYLIQVLPPLALILGQSFDRPRKTWILSAGLVVAVMFFSIGKYKFYFYPVVSYYQNFFEYMVGKKDLRSYRNGFGGSVDRNYRVAEYIRLRTTKDERIFVWGDEPFIYALSHRLPVGKYTVAYHVVDFEGKDETIRDIKEKKPAYIIWPATEKREFDELIPVLMAQYTLVEKIDDTAIFRLTSKK